VKGIKNPKSTEPTDPIGILVYYEAQNDNVELIDVYDGDELFIVA
jgi:hypothetical protein